MIPTTDDAEVETLVANAIETAHDYKKHGWDDRAKREEHVRAGARKLIEEGRRAAAEVAQCQAKEEARVRDKLRASGGKLSDKLLGVSFRDNDAESLKLSWSTKNESYPPLLLFKERCDQLLAQYQARGHDSDLFATRVFAMQMRYEALSGSKSAYQAALPKSLFALLQHTLSVGLECCASPLNATLGEYCSVFKDTDEYFGSHGSFYAFRPKEGSFECNPPFDQPSCIASFHHIAAVLAASDGPLSFVLCVPDMDRRRSGKLNDAFKAIEPFMKFELKIEMAEHAYMMGLQHRPTGQYRERHWPPHFDTMLYILQNIKGEDKYKIPFNFASDVQAAFHRAGTDVG